jgi:hypothetical protein
MARMRLLLWCSALVLAAGLAVGCGDDPATGTGPGDTGDAGTDTRPDTLPDTPPELRNRLVLVTEPEPSVSFSERVPIQVRYVDPDNAPLPDAFVQFAAQGDTGDTRLSAQNALTDSGGVAETFIQAGVQTLDFEVIISVPSDDTVQPLTVRVRVQPKDASDYIIRVTYDGPVALHRVEVLLYVDDRACNALVRDPRQAPSPDVAWTSLVILPDAEGRIPERGLNVPLNTVFHYAVARAEPTDGAGRGRGYFVTFGCNDEIPPVDPASATVIEIGMANLWPAVAGTYQLETELDLIDIIPDSFQPIVEMIGEFFTSPGAGLLRIAAFAIGGDCYWNQGVFDALFDCSPGPQTCDCTNVVLTSGFGVAAASIIETLVNVGIAALPDAVGNTIRDVLQGGADVFTNAQNFTMNGSLIVPQNPDAAGLLGDSNSIVFTSIDVTWRGTERRIDLRDRGFLRAQNINGAVVFHPRRVADYALKLDPFDLSLNYGDLLIWIVESIVFPELIGQCTLQSPSFLVDSFEDLFTCLVNCEAIGDRIANGDPNDPDSTGLGNAIGNAVEAACVQLQLTAVDALENWLSSLTLDLGTYYHMGTPADNPCVMNFAPNSTEFRIQSLGGSALNRRCKWEGEIRFDSNNEESELLDGEWWGERL